MIHRDSRRSSLGSRRARRPRLCVGSTSCTLFFFFQAEDGIRDFHVIGVQTCALPISARGSWMCLATAVRGEGGQQMKCQARRSEERRVGKSVDLGGRRIIKKKKK